MTLTEMMAEVYSTSGNRFQVSESDILRYLSISQQAAFAKDLKVFEETATLSASSGVGPYSFPAAARRVVRIEDSDGNAVAATFQDMRRTVTLSAPPSVDLVWRYYIQPEALTASTDDAKVLIPSEWHHPLLCQCAMLLCDTQNYGDKSPMVALLPYLEPFWEAMAAVSADRVEVISVGAW